MYVFMHKNITKYTLKIVKYTLLPKLTQKPTQKNMFIYK